MNASHSRGMWMVKQAGGADNVLTPLKDPDHSPSSLPERGAMTSHDPRKGARETRLGIRQEGEELRGKRRVEGKPHIGTCGRLTTGLRP